MDLFQVQQDQPVVLQTADKAINRSLLKTTEFGYRLVLTTAEQILILGHLG
jgi:hypothetical protein